MTPETSTLRPDELGPMFGRGRTAEVYALGTDKVVKLFDAGYPPGDALLEWHGARAAEKARLPVPAVYGFVRVGNRQGVVMDRVRGAPLMDALTPDPGSFQKVAADLAALHARIHMHNAPELPSLHDLLAWAIDHAMISQAVRTEAHRRLALLPAGDTLLHLDFHPFQVYINEIHE